MRTPRSFARCRRLTCAFIVTMAALAACGGDGETPGRVETQPQPGFIEVAMDVKAAVGADIDIPGGARLRVAAGALAADTTIRILVPAGQDATASLHRFRMEPAGLTFAVPATLEVPYSDGEGGKEPLISGWHAGASNPLEWLGTSELSNTLPLEPIARDEAGNRISFRVDHFTFYLVAIGVDEMSYLVKHIPPKYLAAGDLLFTLTGGGPGKLGANWQPGHVGIFTGGGAACQPGFVDQLIEATPPPAPKDASGNPLPETATATLGRILLAPGVVKNTLAQFISDPTHIYLGARVPGGADLTAQERTGIVAYANAQLGRPYRLVMGQENTSPDGFSCVGLGEEAYDAVNRGSLGPVEEGLIPTPIELFRKTRPVTDVTVGVGERFDMPVHGVVVHPASPSALLSLRGRYCPSYPCAAADAVHNVVITARTTPPVSATMTLADGGHYLWSFTPGPELAGQTIEVTFDLMPSALTVTGILGGRVAVEAPMRSETLRVHVVPCAAPTPSCPATPTDKAVLCQAAGASALVKAETSTVTLPAGGMHGNSNPLLVLAAVAGPVDLIGLLAHVLFVDDTHLRAAFGNTTFPCGPGPAGLTLCPAAGALGAPGDWVVVQTTLAEAVPTADPTWSFQYGFVFDSDGLATNNYQASPQFADDYYQGTDRWYSAEYSPAQGWKLKVSDARDGQIKEVASGARLVIRDRFMTLMVPRLELAATMLGMRVTGFRHQGDYGQNPPHVYSADTHPAVRMPLHMVVP